MDPEFKILTVADRALLNNVAADVFDDDLIPSLVVVGFASGVHYVHPDKPAELWLNEVGVAPSHQGRGIDEG